MGAGPPADLAAARGRIIPDVLPGPGHPPLRVLFCGINPGLLSAATGCHFARPGNRFWPALHRSGFTPGQQRLLVAGGQRLRSLVREVRPRWLAVVGITAYRVAFAEPCAVVGRQGLLLGQTRVWALPNPSGLNAHWPLPAMVAEFGRLRLAAESGTGGT